MIDATRRNGSALAIAESIFSADRDCGKFARYIDDLKDETRYDWRTLGF